MLVNHLVWEHTSVFVPDEDLLWLHTSQFLNAFIYISGYQVFIAAVHLGIGLFNERYPQLMFGPTSSKHRLVIFSSFRIYLGINRNPLVNNNINPSEVLENPNHVQTNLSKLMEDWRINTL